MLCDAKGKTFFRYYGCPDSHLFCFDSTLVYQNHSQHPNFYGFLRGLTESH